MTAEAVDLDGGVGVVAPAPPRPAPAPSPPVRRREPRRLRARTRQVVHHPHLWVLFVVTTIAVGAGLRFWQRSPLWLDEAQSVAVARLSLRPMFEALRQDGAPPLYYLLLHGWMRMFGTGDIAVRSLSGAASVASLPLIYAMGRRIGGRRVGMFSLLLLASSPFAIRFATETRMYALVVLLTLLGYHALAGCSRRTGALPVVAVALATAALLLTHYWALFLVVVVGSGLVYRSVRGTPTGSPARALARRQLIGVTAGGVLFLPWVPTMAYQLAHTGTPWQVPASLTAVLHAVSQWTGGESMDGRLLELLFFSLLLLGLFGRPGSRRHIVLDLRGAPDGPALGGVSLGTIGLALAAGLVTQSAFADRYTSVAFAPFLVLLGLGSACFVDERLFRGVAVVAVTLGVIAALPAGSTDRTQAGQVAAALRAYAAPGEVVAFCPDQLGPAVSRMAPAGLTLVAYPTLGPADRIDWVDYGKRNAASDPVTFTDRLLATAGTHHGVWLAYNNGYRTMDGKCGQVVSALQQARPGVQHVVRMRPVPLEREHLLYFPPP